MVNGLSSAGQGSCCGAVVRPRHPRRRRHISSSSRSEKSASDARFANRRGAAIAIGARSCITFRPRGRQRERSILILRNHDQACADRGVQPSLDFVTLVAAQGCRRSKATPGLAEGRWCRRAASRRSCGGRNRSPACAMPDRIAAHEIAFVRIGGIRPAVAAGIAALSCLGIAKIPQDRAAQAGCALCGTRS